MTHKTDEALATRKCYGIAGRGEAREFTGLKTRRYSKMLRNREKSSGQWRVGLRVRSG